MRPAHRRDRVELVFDALVDEGDWVTVQRLALRFEVSARSVFRDLAELRRAGLPIAGESGVGVRLDPAADVVLRVPLLRAAQAFGPALLDLLVPPVSVEVTAPSPTPTRTP